MSIDDQPLLLPTDQQLSAAGQVAQKIMNAHSSIDSIALSSVDGRSLLHLTRNQLSADQLAAMTSSAMSLCLALQRELDTGEYQQLALDGLRGRIIILRLHDTLSPLTLTVVNRHHQALGHDLWVAHQLCGSLEIALSA